MLPSRRQVMLRRRVFEGESPQPLHSRCADAGYLCDTSRLSQAAAAAASEVVGKPAAFSVAALTSASNSAAALVLAPRLAPLSRRCGASFGPLLCRLQLRRRRRRQRPAAPSLAPPLSPQAVGGGLGFGRPPAPAGALSLLAINPAGRQPRQRLASTPSRHVAGRRRPAPHARPPAPAPATLTGLC